jgi:hypothetical protein
MPSPEYGSRHQMAVLWEWTGVNRYNEPLIGPQEEITVRWEDMSKDMRRADGTMITVDATAHVDPDRVIPIGSLMWKGEAADLPPGTYFDAEDLEIMEVVAVDFTPDVKARTQYREVGLARFKKALASSVTPP